MGERLVKLIRRRPTLVAAYAMTLLALALGGVVAGVTELWREAVRKHLIADSERRAADDQRKEAEKARGEAERSRARG